MAVVTTVPIRRRLGLIAALTTSLVFAGPDAGIPAKASEASSLRSLHNSERARYGKRLLRYNYSLTRLAVRHARRMASKNRLYHNSRLGYEARNLSWSILGENVGVGTSIESLHRAFMNSPAHRRNILRGRFRRVGIGTAYGGGRLWVTVVFSG